MPRKKRNLKSFKLSLPQKLYDSLEKEAEDREVTPTDLMRQALKLLMLALQLEKDPNCNLCVKEGDKVRELTVII